MEVLAHFNLLFVFTLVILSDSQPEILATYVIIKDQNRTTTAIIDLLKPPFYRLNRNKRKPELEKCIKENNFLEKKVTRLGRI